MMARALNDVGNPATMVTLPGDDHQLRASASRVKMLQSLDAFLAAHLAARP
jgi:dipeptidyl aminopeptidase/acylaminoacyl peptidase